MVKGVVPMGIISCVQILTIFRNPPISREIFSMPPWDSLSRENTFFTKCWPAICPRVRHFLDMFDMQGNGIRMHLAMGKPSLSHGHLWQTKYKACLRQVLMGEEDHKEGIVKAASICEPFLMITLQGFQIAVRSGGIPPSLPHPPPVGKTLVYDMIYFHIY